MQATNFLLSEIYKRVGNGKNLKSKYRNKDISECSSFTAFSVLQLKHRKRGEKELQNLNESEPVKDD